MALYEKAHDLAQQIGMELPHGSAGGGSDANFTGAMGIPTLDGLGRAALMRIRSTSISWSKVWPNAVG